MNRIVDAIALAFVIETLYYEIPLYILLGDWSSIVINSICILFFWVINLKDNEFLLRFAEKMDKKSITKE